MRVPARRGDRDGHDRRAGHPPTSSPLSSARSATRRAHLTILLRAEAVAAESGERVDRRGGGRRAASAANGRRAQRLRESVRVTPRRAVSYTVVGCCPLPGVSREEGGAGRGRRSAGGSGRRTRCAVRGGAGPSDAREPGVCRADGGVARTREDGGGGERVDRVDRVGATLRRVLRDVFEDVPERVPNLGRAPELVGVVTIGEDGAAPSERAVQASREAGGETTGAARGRRCVVGLDDQVDVVG